MSDGFAALGEGRSDEPTGVVAETGQLVNIGKPDRFNLIALDFLAFRGLRSGR
jgi:hypothetical protein